MKGLQLTEMILSAISSGERMLNISDFGKISFSIGLNVLVGGEFGLALSLPGGLSNVSSYRYLIIHIVDRFPVVTTVFPLSRWMSSTIASSENSPATMSKPRYAVCHL